ncbi:DUF3899 domain-containing protein [Rossellomorea vietnamensis]|uniref:DUF3899 domain-containing protein n=1 Tax=Rossellomorea vietnamensis TaxID=218284 RepID=A0A5D4KF84_9BACI|nr:DUF3899 domain-containing protein [Rossellomorea vietnamensis]TYR75971.1 DUF3899 domain-containing protein [Rossellomorea vietnamensis]
MRNYILTTFIAFITLAASQLLMNIEPVTMVNKLFYWGLISLLFGAGFYIFQTGFLNLFFGGFKRLTTVVVPRSRSLERTDRQLKEDVKLNEWKEAVCTKSKQLFLGIGSGMALFSVFGLLFI